MEMLIPMATTGLQGIRGLQSEEARNDSANGGSAKLDSCYAYGRSREVVKMLWPERYEPPPA
jgi:hypothetical protein